MFNSVQHRRRVAAGLTVVSLAFLALIAGVSVYLSRREPEDERFVRLFDPASRHQFSEEERRELFEQWKRLDPETRRRISTEVFHRSVDRFREEFGRKSEAEQRAWVEAEVARAQERLARLSREDRATIQERLQTPEAREHLQHLFETYHEELSARERAMLEPLAREAIRQLEAFR